MAAWALAAVAGAAATGIFLVMPKGTPPQAAVYLTVAVAAHLAMVLRLRRLPAAERRTWTPLLVGMVVYLLTTAWWYLRPLLGAASQVSLLAEVPFFVAYGCYGLALLRLARSYSGTAAIAHERVAVVDSGILTAALLAVLWPVGIAQDLARTTLATVEVASALAYLVATALVFGLGVRTVFAAGRSPALGVLLAGWLVGELVSVAWYGHAVAVGTFQYGHPMFAGWLVSYTCLGAAALHPALTRLAQPSPPRLSSRPWRLWVLTAAALLPLVMAKYADDQGRPAVLALAAVSFGLVMVRMTMVAGDLENQRRLGVQLAEMAEEMLHRALHDPLTGLGNRVLFMERLTHAMRRRPTSATTGTALLLLDLDGFKAVNDTLGHDTGDQMLVAVADRLRQVVRAHDTIARLGGDEFAVVAEDVDGTTAARLAVRVVESLQRPIDVDGDLLPASASVGVHLADECIEPVVALKRADLAMYAAKRHGGNRFQLFADDLQEDFLRRHRLERQLRGAVDGGELEMHYQPIVDLGDSRMVGVEGLMRWRHPERGLIGPGEFMAVAEESGTIVEMGRWVLEECCHQLVRWSASGDLPAGFHVAVNLSRRQLADPSIESTVADTIRRIGVAPHAVILEVTETALMADLPRLSATLERLKQLGVQIAMDDFGTGYSSLDQLRRLPIDILKIDRAFVQGIGEQREDFALATAIVSMATGLGKRTLAEGVEAPAQLAHLRALGVEMAQGYLFSRPVTAGAITAMLAAGHGGQRDGIDQPPRAQRPDRASGAT